LVFVHKYSGVLSAFGLSKSEIVEERRRYAGIEISRGAATD
jgi:N-methylhydantoinase A/oxoprolinase/acetone carboxylase beta subunit